MIPNKVNRQLPLGSEMPPAGRTKGIVWLEIHEGVGGFFLYHFAERNSPPKWDTFIHDLDDIFEDCQRIWGIDRNAWQPISGESGQESHQ